MRTQDEIQAAHDACVAVIIKEAPNPFGPGQLASLDAAASVLCWVLHHEHNDSFAKNLALIHDEAARQGLTLTKHPPTCNDKLRDVADLNSQIVIVHTPQGPVPSCHNHVIQLKALLAIMGVASPAIELALPGTLCVNCENEAKEKVHAH